MADKNGIVKFLTSIKALILTMTAAIIFALATAFIDVQLLKAEVEKTKDFQSIISTDLNQVKKDVSFIKGWVEAQ